MLEASPLSLFFWIIWEERNQSSFENEELFSVQRTKRSFLIKNENTFLSWTKLYIVKGPISLIDFVDWLNTH